MELLSLSFPCPWLTTVQLMIILSYDGTERMVVTTGCQSSSCPNTPHSHGIIISNLSCLFSTKSMEKLTGKDCKYLRKSLPHPRTFPNPSALMQCVGHLCISLHFHTLLNLLASSLTYTVTLEPSLMCTATLTCTLAHPAWLSLVHGSTSHTPLSYPLPYFTFLLNHLLINIFPSLWQCITIIIFVLCSFIFLLLIEKRMKILPFIPFPTYEVPFATFPNSHGISPHPPSHLCTLLLCKPGQHLLHTHLHLFGLA